MTMALNAKQAAARLGVSRTHFYKVIKKHLKCVNLAHPDSRKPMWRWRTETLDEYLKQREQ